MHRRPDRARGGPEIAELVRRNPPEEAADLLIDLANSRGGSDNIGVVIVSAPDGESRVPTVVAAPQERPLIQSALGHGGRGGGLAGGLLILLGIYYPLYARRRNRGASCRRSDVPEVQASRPRLHSPLKVPVDQGASTGRDTPVPTGAGRLAGSRGSWHRESQQRP